MNASMLKKIALAAAAGTLALFALAGCSQPAGNTAAKTQTINDAYDRTVEVPVDVASAATVGSAARFVVYAGGQDKLVAVTEMDTPAAPSRPYTEVYADQFAKLPSTSNGNHLNETTVDTEKMLELKPDVIISSRSAEECDTLQKDTGIPVIGISYQGQLFTDNVYNSIQVVGKTLGTVDHADKVVAAMKGWAADLDKRTKDIPEADKPKVYVGAVNYKGAKGFTGTYCKYPCLDAVHAINVADSLDKNGSVEVDLEQVGEWNPDFMFLNAGNMELMKKEYEANKDFFDGMSAFRQGNLYTQPSFNMNGTNVEMGICDAFFCGATLYPNAFADVDLPAKYDEVFSTMMGKNYYETMKGLGMDFKKMKL